VPDSVSAVNTLR